MWHTNKDIRYTYAANASCVCWAWVDGLGWRSVQTGAPDGCTNLFIQLNAARANNRKVHVFINTSNFITAVILL